MMGSRTAGNEKAAECVSSAGEDASADTFANAAAHGGLLFNCTGGAVSIDAIGSARAGDLAGKILVDVANPLHFSHAAHALRLLDGQPRRVDPARLP